MIFKTTLESIDTISNDVTSGAAEIEIKAAGIFHRFIEQFDKSSNKDLHIFKTQIETLCIKLVQAQPTMAPLFNLSNTILQLLETKKTLEELKKVLTHALIYDDTTKKILENAKKIITSKSKVITHSRSSTIVNILKDIKGINVICTESRPLNEGRRLAKELSTNGIHVTLVADAAIFSEIHKATCILVGADAINKDGVANKIGTSAIAHIAKDLGIPLYVVSSKRKIYPFSVQIGERNPREIWHDPPSGVKVKNYYFDLTPFNLIKFLITEDGLITGSIIKQEISSMTIAPQLLRLAEYRS